MTKTTKKPLKKNKKNTFSYVSVGAIVAYSMIAIMSDIFSNKTLAISGWAVSGGMLLVPFAFVIRDLMHRLLGYKNTLKFVVATALANLFFAGMLVLLTSLPAQDPSFGAAWETAMGSSWRIIFASFIAQLLADLCDTWVFERFVRKFGDTKIWLRCLASNAISVPVDSVVFILLAFLGALPSQVVISMIITQIVIKFVVSAVFTPLAYLRPKKTAELQ